MFSQDILLYERPEVRQVPDVYNEESNTIRQEEREREDTKVEETLIVHPSNDEDPNEEFDDIQESVLYIFFWIVIFSCYDV